MEPPEPTAKKFDDIAVGESAELTVLITPELVDDFARLSGDYNPLHTDDAYAAATPFGHRIAHGMLAGALFSRLLGMQLPGLYCVYLSQTLQFKKPALLGTEALIKGIVAAKSEASQTLTINLEMRDMNTKDLLVSGDALVRVSA